MSFDPKLSFFLSQAYSIPAMFNFHLRKINLRLCIFVHKILILILTLSYHWLTDQQGKIKGKINEWYNSIFTVIPTIINHPSKLTGTTRSFHLFMIMWYKILFSRTIIYQCNCYNKFQSKLISLWLEKYISE